MCAFNTLRIHNAYHFIYAKNLVLLVRLSPLFNGILTFFKMKFICA